MSLPQLGAGNFCTLLYSRVWLLRWGDCKAEFSCDCQPEDVRVACPCGWVPCSMAVGFQEEQFEMCVPRELGGTDEEVTNTGSMRGAHRLYLLKGEMSKNWWSLSKNHNTYCVQAGDASKLFNNYIVIRIGVRTSHTLEQIMEHLFHPHIRY